MNRRPVIGVTTSRHKSLIAYFCDWLAVYRAGGRAVRIMPGGPVPAVGDFDGLIVGGGDDIGAELYGGEVTLGVRTDPDRDDLERDLLGQALASDIPVLGICRGAQMINVHLGGTLMRDVYDQFSEKRRLRTVLPRMDVHIVKETHLSRILERARYRVNSLHHQAVDRLGHGLRVAARDDHGVVQAIESEARPFLFGVQWHPEFLVFWRSQQSLFRAMVKAAHHVRAAQSLGR